MPGLGTLINVGGVIVGGIGGMLFGKHLSERMQDSLMKANGIVVMFIGITGVLQYMMTVEDGHLGTQKVVMAILSMVTGTVIGEAINIDGLFERFGSWLKVKSHSEGDSGFINAFVVASLTTCVGAMSILGSIEDGIHHDPTMLTTKAVLDLIIVMLLTTSLGKGCIFSAISVGVFQGTITALASFIAPFITEGAMNNLSLVGSMLIFAIAINLILDTKIRVANFLPAIFIAALLSIWW